MVTVTKADLGRNVSWFIAEVLRNNLSDPNPSPRNGKDWIFKSQPTDPVTPQNTPRIIIDETDAKFEQWDLGGSKYESRTITLEIWVFAMGNNAIAIRDSLADQIRQVLFNEDSKDANGKSLRDMKLRLRRLTESVEDHYGAHPKIIRAKRLEAVLTYYGD